MISGTVMPSDRRLRTFATTVSVRMGMRIYLERYERDPSRQNLDCQAALADLAAAAQQIARIEEKTGRRCPSLIT